MDKRSLAASISPLVTLAAFKHRSNEVAYPSSSSTEAVASIWLSDSLRCGFSYNGASILKKTTRLSWREWPRMTLAESRILNTSIPCCCFRAEKLMPLKSRQILRVPLPSGVRGSQSNEAMFTARSDGSLRVTNNLKLLSHFERTPFLPYGYTGHGSLDLFLIYHCTFWMGSCGKMVSTLSGSGSRMLQHLL